MKLFDAIKKSIISFQQVMSGESAADFDTVVYPKNLEPYLYHAWVNIAVNILTRNIARAKFIIQRKGDDVKDGRLCELFCRPNETMSGFDLWKETAAWWALEGEAFWWFGADYSGGIPDKIYILNPRYMRHEAVRGVVTCNGILNKCRWFYETEAGSVPILSDELIHFRDWNPWNAVRGVNPLMSLALELEQDYYANKANSELLKHNAIPHGILKTEQTIRPEEADALERRWESKFGIAKTNRKIAVLGKGTTFEPMSFTPEVVKLFELKRWNLYTILAKYGIPPRVANINDKSSALSGKDTMEQHAAFWKYTILPLLKQFENIIESQFFIRLCLIERGVFDLRDIPELQESEDAQSKRDIAEINAGLKTMNLPALKGGVSCKRCIVYEVRSVRKLFNCGVYYHFLLTLPILSRPKGRGIRPHCE